MVWNVNGLTRIFFKNWYQLEPLLPPFPPLPQYNIGCPQCIGLRSRFNKGPLNWEEGVKGKYSIEYRICLFVHYNSFVANFIYLFNFVVSPDQTGLLFHLISPMATADIHLQMNYALGLMNVCNILPGITTCFVHQATKEIWNCIGPIEAGSLERSAPEFMYRKKSRKWLDHGIITIYVCQIIMLHTGNNMPYV